ncbi:MAG: hypothetical protein AAF655_18330 [Bacteroidota bacterium]
MSRLFHFTSSLLQVLILLLVLPSLGLAQDESVKVDFESIPTPIVLADGSMDLSNHQMKLIISLSNISGLQAITIEKGNLDSRTYEAPMTILYGSSVQGVTYEESGKKITVDLGNATEQATSRIMFRVLLDYQESGEDSADTYAYYP